MINKITFLLQRKKNASSHLFSKQLKNLQSNHLIGGFIPIIYSNQAVNTLPAATIHTLSAQPSLRIELGSLFTKLELKDVVGTHGTQSLTGTYLLTLMNADRFQITVNRDVGTMTDQHVPHATITEDGTHLTIVDAASHTTRLALNVDTLIVRTCGGM